MTSITHRLSHYFASLDTPRTIAGGVATGAFLETTVLPVPFEAALVPLMLARREHLPLITVAALGGCLVGSLAGYLVGMLAFNAFGQPLLEWLGAADAMEAFRQRLATNGFVALFLVGFTPIPIQVATLTAGFAHFSLAVFFAAMTLSRALRYGGLALLVYWLGDRTLGFMRRHRKTSLAIGVVLTVVLIGVLG